MLGRESQQLAEVVPSELAAEEAAEKAAEQAATLAAIALQQVRFRRDLALALQ